MLNIQLFLEGKEVELNNSTSFPLNKTFDHLWNPTDIIVEYSKSINIPATKTNNRLMANAYRLDRQFSINEDKPNIGMYLDPLKRIPMKLIYNGSVLLDGYAKYTSATVNSKESYYTFNLYGALGDVFQTLMDCVTDPNKLTDEQKSESDGGQKYVISSIWDEVLIDRNFVKNCWDNDSPTPATSTAPSNYIGMAPAYRGLYEDFESTSIWISTQEAGEGNPNVSSVEDYLKKKWTSNLVKRGYTQEKAEERVDALDFNMILPNGLSEHNIRQFRSYEQKPYIYIHGLFDLFSQKCESLTGYKINLDENWFNDNNPYWSRLCYMFDYLSTRGVNTEQYSPFCMGTLGMFSKLGTYNTYSTVSYSTTYTNFATSALESGSIKVAPFDVQLEIKRMANEKDPLIQGTGTWNDTFLGLSPLAHMTVDVTFTNSNGASKVFNFWGATDKTKVTPADSKYTSRNYFPVLHDIKIEKTDDGAILTGIVKLDITGMDLGKFDTTGLTMKVDVSVYNPKSGDQLTAYYYPFLYKYRNTTTGGTLYNGLSARINDPNFSVNVSEMQMYSNWRLNTTCSLKNLYVKEEPLFNVILQYAKMFGLVWKVDYNTKTINIMCRSTYFKDFNVVDWTDKVDRSKDVTIEPVSFNSKYITFNYDDVKGFRYSGYKNKYGVGYGEKKLKTRYNFDTKESKLFTEKIGPSSVSCKSFPILTDMVEWNTLTTLPSRPSEVNFIDCEDEEEQSAISLNNWYFRLPNKTVTGYYMISDVSPVEITDGKYYWVDNVVANGQVGGNTQVLPQFSPVFKSDTNGVSYGCLFNCPNDDYTNDNHIGDAKGNYIYDLCWKDYINERYNANNKKLTCYIKINPIEFEKFNFKTFVTIDNQLFVVNKISDYDINMNTTKCEFIQVSNTNGYTTQGFDFQNE